MMIFWRSTKIEFLSLFMFNVFFFMFNVAILTTNIGELLAGLSSYYLYYCSSEHLFSHLWEESFLVTKSFVIAFGIFVLFFFWYLFLDVSLWKKKLKMEIKLRKKSFVLFFKPLFYRFVPFFDYPWVYRICNFLSG